MHVGATEDPKGQESHAPGAPETQSSVRSNRRALSCLSRTEANAAPSKAASPARFLLWRYRIVVPMSAWPIQA